MSKRRIKMTRGLSSELSDKQLKTLISISDKHKVAQKQVAKAMGVLWNSRLDMAIALEDTDRIDDAIGDIPMILDDCSCNDGCNPQCPPPKE